MSESNADQRFAPPQAHVADLATGEVVLAGRGTRLLGAIIDGLLLAAVIWGVGRIPAIGAILQPPDQVPSLTSFNFLSPLLGFSVFLLVQGWPLVTRQQTIGKILLGMRIVRSDGSKPEAWRLLGLRYGIGIVAGMHVSLSMIYGLLDCLLIFRESRKCLHDSIADTQVIKL